MGKAGGNAVVVLLQALLVGCAVLLAAWVRLPLLIIFGMALLGISLAPAKAAARVFGQQVESARLTAAWSCSLFVWASLLLTTDIADTYYAMLACLLTASLLLARRRVADTVIKARWKLLVAAWAWFSCCICIATGYLHNQAGTFYIGLLLALALLAAGKRWFRMTPVGIQFVNTLFLLLVGLPVADLMTRPQYRMDMRPETWVQHYSYERAKGNPSAFARWSEFYDEQSSSMGREVFEPCRLPSVPYKLRPNSHGFLFQCPISINSRGFRGREFPLEKGNAYRIVALGESTTFGITLKAGDKPWPELLEQMIRERLKPRRPVEVINAGIPAHSIQANLMRLKADILPLKPDMIISYHGINGFPMINNAVPRAFGPAPPAYRERPLYWRPIANIG